MFDKIDALSSDDAIDFYSFSVSSPRSVVFRFLSGNSNYTANLGALDTSNGNVTLSNLWLSPNDVKWSSELPAGNYCWVILSKSNTYTTDKYRISMNALNTSGATQHMIFEQNAIVMASIVAVNFFTFLILNFLLTLKRFYNNILL